MAAVKRFSQVLDRGFVYNGQSAWFDKSTLDTQGYMFWFSSGWYLRTTIWFNQHRKFSGHLRLEIDSGLRVMRDCVSK
jgi:hypothetical protein